MRSTHNSPCLGGVGRVVGCILLGAGAADPAFHSSPRFRFFPASKEHDPIRRDVRGGLTNEQKGNGKHE